MKKWILFLVVVLIYPVVVLCQGDPEFVPSDITAAEPPAWLEVLIGYLVGLPVVGPVMVEIAKWVGAVAGIMTSIFMAFFGVMKGLSKALGWAKLIGAAQKVDAIYAKFGPWLMYLSIFNVKKPLPKILPEKQ